jgi:nitronate monooxygenase
MRGVDPIPSDLPVVGAPMAGGPSSPELVAAVSTAGGLGLVAGGYRTAEALADEIERVRALLAPGVPFGANLFTPVPGPGDPVAVAAYAQQIAPLAEAAGITLGAPRFDDDDFEGKLQVIRVHRPPVVTFAFGRPEPGLTRELQADGIAVWVTVTTLAEAEQAAEGGADGLVVQGAEAGGHRGGFADDASPLPLIELLPKVARLGPLIVAAGGIMDGPDAARARALGADAVQVGTALLLTPEAGTPEVHRRAVAGDAPTVLTRAFTGRLARGIANAWTAGPGIDAPPAYPELHHLTQPLRMYGRAQADPDLVNLWAGTGHARARAVPAATIVAELAAGLR